jgi:hypothetical protein
MEVLKIEAGYSITYRSSGVAASFMSDAPDAVRVEHGV